MTIAIWPVWGWLSFPMVFTLLLGFLNTGHFLPNHSISTLLHSNSRRTHLRGHLHWRLLLASLHRARWVLALICEYHDYTTSFSEIIARCDERLSSNGLPPLLLLNSPLKLLSPKRFSAAKNRVNEDYLLFSIVLSILRLVSSSDYSSLTISWWYFRSRINSNWLSSSASA
jgi:hypothetical protein